MLGELALVGERVHVAREEDYGARDLQPQPHRAEAIGRHPHARDREVGDATYHGREDGVVHVIERARDPLLQPDDARALELDAQLRLEGYLAALGPLAIRVEPLVLELHRGLRIGRTLLDGEHRKPRRVRLGRFGRLRGYIGA